MTRSAFIRAAAACIAGLLPAGSGAAGEGTGPWTFTAGPAYRAGMCLKITGGSHAQTDNWRIDRPASWTGPTRGRRPAADAAGLNAFADRTFDDGFVFIDPGTVDFGGDTWFWGYENASQVDGPAGTLSFHNSRAWDETTRSGESRITTTKDTSVYSDDHVEGAGLELACGYSLLRRDRAQLDWFAGFTGLWDIDQRMETSTYAQRMESRTRERTDHLVVQDTYVYDLKGVVPPPAPYEGTYEGWPPPSPLLPNRPQEMRSRTSSAGSESRVVSSRQASAWNSIAFETDAEACSFWTGPRAAWSVMDGLEVFLRPALSATLAVVRTDRRETMWLDQGGGAQAVQTWTDDRDRQTWRLGFGLQGGAEASLGGGWFVFASGGYEWVPDPVELDAGPNRVELDLSGTEWNGGLGCHW